VEPEVIEGLKDAAISDLWAPARQGWAELRRSPDGQRAWFLTQREGGRCVFLRDDDLCAVHALLGADAKPGFCRTFPYHLVDDPVGTVAVVRPMCAGFHKRFRDGDDPRPEAEALARQQTAVPRRRFAPDQVAVVPGVAVDLETWMTWEADALQALRDAPDATPGAAVALVRDTLYRRAGTEGPPARADQARAAASAVCLGLGQVLTAVAQQPGPEERKAFVVEAIERLARARQTLEAGPLPVPDPELAAWAHLLLRSHLLAKGWSAWGSVDAGVGAFALGWTIARAQAPEGDLDAVQPAYRAWRLLEANAMVQHVLRRARAALVDAFLHAR
jgi:hypothetical protein